MRGGFKIYSPTQTTTASPAQLPRCPRPVWPIRMICPLCFHQPHQDTTRGRGEGGAELSNIWKRHVQLRPQRLRLVCPTEVWPLVQRLTFITSGVKHKGCRPEQARLKVNSGLCLDLFTELLTVGKHFMMRMFLFWCVSNMWSAL